MVCTLHNAIHLPLISGQSTCFAGGKLLQRGENLAPGVEPLGAYLPLRDGGPMLRSIGKVSSRVQMLLTSVTISIGTFPRVQQKSRLHKS